jgi:hypothetical protein
MSATIVAGRTLWRHEIAEARRLGFRLQLSMGVHAAFARLVPNTPHARALCAAHGGARAIEAQQVYPQTDDVRERAHLQLEAQRDAIHGALMHARHAAAA